MNESVFKEILGEALKRDLEKYDNAPDHKFSLKHRLAMKRIFAKYARNVRKLKKEEKIKEAATVEYKPRLNLKYRVITALLIIVLMSLLVGWVVVFTSEKFHGTVYHNNTQLTAVETKNSPTTIEYKYVFAFVPEGFELKKTGISPSNVYSFYSNPITGQEITLIQWVKANFDPHYNTEHHHFEELTINGKLGLYIDFSDTTNSNTLLVWDNEDYIIEIVADLDKTETLNLVNFNKF